MSLIQTSERRARLLWATGCRSFLVASAVTSMFMINHKMMSWINGKLKLMRKSAPCWELITPATDNSRVIWTRGFLFKQVFHWIFSVSVLPHLQLLVLIDFSTCRRCTLWYTTFCRSFLCCNCSALNVRIEWRAGERADGKFFSCPEEKKKKRHHLSFDHDAMMMEQKPRTRGSLRQQSLTTSGHKIFFFHTKIQKKDSYMMKCSLCLLKRTDLHSYTPQEHWSGLEILQVEM